MHGPDFLEIYERALAAIEKGDAVAANKRAAVLALARGGATQLALQKYTAFGLDDATDEDALSLRGRLLKDTGLMKGAARGRADLQASADAYYKAYQITRGSYSGINAATLFLLSGQGVRSQSLAQDVLDSLQRLSQAGPSEAQYFRMATIAEAQLLLDRPGAAETALANAIAVDPENYPAHASTLRQFVRILEFKSLPTAWLDAFRPPAIACYAGRIQGFDPGDQGNEIQIRAAAATAVRTNRIGVAYGALAAGSDIILAEAFLDAGCALRVILPCAAEAFQTHSVLPFGPAWRERYVRCLARAESIDIATNDTSLMGRVAVQLAAELAMGRAVVCADSLATSAVQVLLAPSDRGHTRQSHDTWNASGLQLKTLILGNDLDWPVDDDLPGIELAEDHRQLAAMLFADFAGFGQLADRQVATVVHDVLPVLADVLHGWGGDLLHLNSWGDGIFAMFSSVAIAADAAIAMQTRLRSMDLAALGLPETLALRIGGHYGPVSFATDSLTGRQAPFGSQIAYAARIEPVAVPGSILVSDAFAARLALSSDSRATVSYVGRHRLKHAPTDARLYALTDPAGITATVPK